MERRIKPEKEECQRNRSTGYSWWLTSWSPLTTLGKDKNIPFFYENQVGRCCQYPNQISHNLR